jgi:hypothetical protein
VVWAVDLRRSAGRSEEVVMKTARSSAVVHALLRDGRLDQGETHRGEARDERDNVSRLLRPIWRTRDVPHI